MASAAINKDIKDLIADCKAMFRSGKVKESIAKMGNDLLEQAKQVEDSGLSHIYSQIIYGRHLMEIGEFLQCQDLLEALSSCLLGSPDFKDKI